MVRLHIIIIIVLTLPAWRAQGQSAKNKNHSKKKSVYEQVDFEDVVRRYFGKDIGTPNSIEGIYSVSCVITKRSKGFLSDLEQTKIVERRDNYARVAIMRDWPGTKRDFIEVSLSSREPNHYPIVGELNFLSEGRGLIYKHIEPNTSTISFSMASDSSDLIEAVYSFMRGKQTITYQMSYIKIYPKSTNFVVEKH